MQSDSPESDPRLQRTNPGPKVTTGFVDPCIVYLEATLPGEIPVLYTCWAHSSHEIRKGGFKTHLNLTDVVTIKWRPVKTKSGWKQLRGKAMWSFGISRHKSLLVASRDRATFVRCSEMRVFADESGNPLTFDGAIRFIDSNVVASLERSTDNLGSANELARKLLNWAPVDWPSISDALASLEPSQTTKLKTSKRKSLIQRFVSSVFKKQPVSA